MNFKNKTEIQNWIKNMVRIDENGCWNASKSTKNVYAARYINGNKILLHRLSYSVFIDKLFKKLVIDHLCKNKKCINPLHLEQVTFRENLIRGDTLASVNINKTHCIRGHEYNQKNTHITRHLLKREWKIVEHRRCRQCMVDKSRQFRLKKLDAKCILQQHVQTTSNNGGKDKNIKH